MKHLKISGNIVLDNNKVSEFKKKLQELIKKYSKSNLSSSCKIISTQNLDNQSKDKKYKAGQIYKLNIEHDFLNYHVLFLAVSEKFCIVAILSKDALEFIKIHGKKRDVYDRIDPCISYLYFEEGKDDNKLLYDLRTFDENNKAQTLDIDSRLTYVEDIDDNILANIVAKFRARDKKIKED